MSANAVDQGATGAAGGVLSGTYPNPGMAAGAAAANLGAAGGALTGTYPNPGLASSALTGQALSLQLAPTGATGETITRQQATTDSGAVTSGTLFCFSIALPSGTLVSNLTFSIGNTAEATGTHGAYLLADNTRTVRAVSADQTAAAAFSPVNTPLTLAMQTPFTTTYTGRYYVCVYVTATTPPSFAATASRIGGPTAILPVLDATSNTGLTTPPTVNTVLAALTAFNATMYCYTS